jgi:hypothetical protein
MFIPSDIQSNDIAIYKIIKTNEAKESQPGEDKSDGIQFSISGFSQDNDVIFELKDQHQNLSQRFGFNLKYYRAHQIPDYRARKGADGLAEGAYIFKVDQHHLKPV